MTRPIEHRRSRRFEGAVDVDLTDAKGTRRGRAVDVARHGLFVALHELPASRHLVQLRIHLPDGEVQAAATVARRQPGRGVGLALFALSDVAKARWDAFVQRAQTSHLQRAVLDARQLKDAARSGTPSATMRASGPPAAATASSAPGPAPANPSASTFFLRLRTVDRLREYQRLHVEAGGTILFTPALLPAGAPVTILVVHPVTQVEFPLAGVVHRAVATQPKRLEILFRQPHVSSFERFVDSGARPDVPAGPSSSSPPGPGLRPDDELEFDIDDAIVSDDPVGWDLNCSVMPVQQPPIPHDSIPPSPAGDDDFDLQIEVRDHPAVSDEGDAVELTPPPASALSLLAAPVASWPHRAPAPADLPVAIGTLAPDAPGVADAPVSDAPASAALASDALASDALASDAGAPADDGAAERVAYVVGCSGCDVAPYTIVLGPCAGTLGLVADLTPLWDGKAGRVVTVPRLVAAPVRRARWNRYVARGGSGNDLTSLSALFDVVALAEAPVHPQTDAVLRSTRAVERLAAAAGRLAGPGDKATTKVGCPTCRKGQLKLQRT